MKTAKLDNFLANLTLSQQEYVIAKLKSIIIPIDEVKPVSCPCCGENNFIKHSKYKQTQKYKCKITSRIFSYKTKTVISGISDIKKFNQLLELIVNKHFPTITEIEQKLSISRQTAFDWRTKVLTALYHVVDLDNQVIEFDETNFRLSRKGRKGMLYSRQRGSKLVGDNNYNVKVFMSYSRTTGRLELYQSHMGRSTSQDVENYLGVKDGLVVYCDKHRSYKKYLKDRKVLHSTFLSGYHVSKRNKGVHNQTLNYYGGMLQRFLNDDLKGVSTKYIQGYMNWIMFMENIVKQKKVVVKDAVIENKLALDIFKQKEREFQYFLKINGRNNYGEFRERYSA
jgi:transposase-like protein